MGNFGEKGRWGCVNGSAGVTLVLMTPRPPSYPARFCSARTQPPHPPWSQECKNAWQVPKFQSGTFSKESKFRFLIVRGGLTFGCKEPCSDEMLIRCTIPTLGQVHAQQLHCKTRVSAIWSEQHDLHLILNPRAGADGGTRALGRPDLFKLYSSTICQRSST